ncbi:cell cycle protein [Paenibacillus macquariensis subsp. macquariensis]|nr:cell cycle protein [Paenibacillus macquariensis subsp. macquariensis]
MLYRWRNIDWFIVGILLLFMAISITLIHSGVAAWPEFIGYDKRMLFYYILGFICFFGVSFFNYRFIIKYHWWLLGGGLFLLFITSYIGVEVNDSKGWIQVPFVGLNLQPAELFKLVLIISLSAIVAQNNKEELSFLKKALPLFLLTCVPFVIVIGQNDMGNALCYFVILLGILWTGNLKYSHTIMILLLISVFLYIGIKSYISFHDQISSYLVSINKEHYLNRLDPWLIPDQASRDASYHTKNALTAIGSGGLFGEGYMQGSSVQFNLVPYTYSDSIIVVVAEEFGFVGVAVLLLLYFFLIYRLILIALGCKLREGSIIIIGIISMFLYQIFENIGMFLGLMPLTGITLPFISFGGSSLLINMVSLGLVISIQMDHYAEHSMT